MNEKINVITLVKNTDDDGFETVTPETNVMYANVESTNYQDFYGSKNENTRASIVFVVRREDYDTTRYTVNKKHYYPDKVEWDGAEYQVIRTYYKDQHYARLICG